MPYPSTVAASSVFSFSSAALGQRNVDYTQNGVWWIAVRSATSDEVWFYYSTNEGNTWNYVSTMDLNPAGQTNDYGTAMFIDKDDFMHLLVSGSDGSSNVTHYYRGVPDTGRTFYTLTHTGSNDEVSNGTAGFGNAHDIVAFRDNTSGWHVWFTTGYWDTTYWYARMNHITLNSSGVPTAIASTFPDTGLNTNTGQWYTSLDFRHTAADPKAVQSSLPHLYISMVQNSDDFALWYKKYTYSAGSWTPGSTQLIEGSAHRGYAVGLVYDGTRISMSSVMSGSPDDMVVWERDEADTTTSTRYPTSAGDGEVRAGGIGCDLSGNIFITQAGATSQDVKKNRFNRGTNTWGGWTTLRVGTITYEQILQSRYLRPGATGILPVLFKDTGSSEILFTALWTANEAEASLQGVATATPTGAVGVIGQSSLQGVGSVSALSAIGYNPPVTMQGVGTMSLSPTYSPKKDFTVYDGYVDNPVSGTIPFIYFEDDSARAQTTSRPLRPPRTDTGQDPTEVRPESGEIFSQQDFSHGSGQLYFHHEGRDVRRFLWSEGFEVEIDTVGQPTLLHHLNDVPSPPSLASGGVGKIEVFNDSPFVIDGTGIKKGSGDFPGFWLSENPGGTPQDITSSGEFLYAALGAAGIARRDTSGAWTIWQATPLATRVAWVKNRIMASDGTTTYEITDTVRTVETLPAGWVFEAIFEAGGFIYAVANNASSGLSRISTYGLNSAGDAIEKKNETPFPRNQLMYSGRGFLGSVYIGGGIKNSDEGFDPVVYQAFPQDNGALTYLKVNEGEGAGAIDLSVKALEPIGEDIVFGWSLGSGFDFGPRDGLAIHKPKVDAFLGYLKKQGPGAGRQVLGIALYRGRLLFTLKGDGLYYEDTTHFVSQAQLWTSVADWQTTTKKSWDTIQISHNRLPADTTVRAEYSTRLPSEGVWNQGVLSDVDNSEVAESGFTDVVSQMLSLRLTSTANAAKTEAPSGLGFLVRSNVIPDHPEFGLTRYVRLVNKDRKDSDAPMVFTDVAAVRRKLHNLAYQWVTLYEPGVVWTLHVDSVAEVQPFLVEYDATLGEGQAQGYVIQLTMTGTRD